MKIDNQPLEDHQVKLIVEIEDDGLNEAKRLAARNIARKMKIPGFRPGKAPLPVIIRAVGEEAIQEEALEIWVNDNYPQIIEQSGIKSYGPGKLENITSIEPPILEFIVPLEPVVTLGDYHSIRRPYEPKQITDDDVNEVLENLRGRMAVQEPVTRPIQEGDVVTMHFHGERFEAGKDPKTTEIPERSNQVLVRPSLDAARYEWPFPGFSQELVGLSIADQKTVSHKYSDDYELESLRGVQVTYHVIVDEIKERQLPELNDEFANQVGDYENLPAMMMEIRDSLERRALQEYIEEYDSAIMQELVEKSEIVYPPQMVEEERHNIIASWNRRLEEQGSNLDLYLKTREQSMQAFEEEITPHAEQRLKESLALVELAKVEDIQIDPNEVRTETARTVEMLSQSMSEKEMRQLSSERALSSMYSNVMVDLMTRRAYERLREIASDGASKTSEDASETTATVDETTAVSDPAEDPAELQAQPDDTLAVE